MKKQIKNGVEKASSFALPKLEEELAMKTYGRGDDPIYYGGMLPEVVITGSGDNYIDWSDTYATLSDLFGDNSGSDDGWGGGPSSGSSGTDSDTDNYNYGLQVLDQFGQDITDGSITGIQATQTSNGWKFTKVASLTLEMQEVAPSIITLLREDAGFIGKIGDMAGAIGVPLSTLQFIVGASDGEISASDWCTGADALFGGMALVAGMIFMVPEIAALLTVGSIVFGIASLIVPGDSGSNSETGTTSTGYYN